MHRVDLKIHVIPSGIDPSELTSYQPIRDGNTLSTAAKINVNRVATGYSLIYESEEFVNVNQPVLMGNLVKIFKQNDPFALIDVSLYYDFETDDDAYFDMEVYSKLIDIQNLCENIISTKRVDNMEYTVSESMNDVEEYVEYLSGDNNEDEEDDDETDYENDDPFGIMKAITGYEEDDDRPKRKKKKSSKSKEYYGRSRVWKDAKSPKRSVRRHGVIIADDKDDIKKDEKIIKEFLKDFMPGSAGWQKDFRANVTKRWINMYAVSKKNLKRLEKQHRKNRHKKHYDGLDINKTLSLTNRLLNVPVDCWNDPTK